MLQLWSMVYRIIVSARQQILLDLILLQVDSEGGIAANRTACPAIYWDRLVDNAAEKRFKWSFMEDPRNKHATSMKEPKQ
jgi:hypothetical protein